MKKTDLIEKLPFDLQMFTEGEGTLPAEGVNLEGGPGAQGNDPEGGDPDEGGKTFTQAELDQIVEDRLKREAKKAEKRQQEAARLAGMNAQERETERLKQLEKRLADFERKDAENAMYKEVSSMFKNANLSIPDSVMSTFVREDADETKEATTEFIKWCLELEESIKKKVQKEMYTGKAPKVNTTPSVTKDDWTYEKIMQVKDVEKRQELIQSHGHLFGIQ